MQQAGVGIGDTLLVGAQEGPTPPPPVPLRVVGEVITPTSLVSESSPGEGAAVVPAAALRLEGGALTRDMVVGLPFLVRFRDGTDGQAEVDRLLAAFPDGTYSVPAEHRGDISTLGRISNVPLAFALLLGLLAIGTLAQTLVTSVRARRRDLAILKTVGFSRRQLRGTVAWQASTLAAVALVVGLPVGVLAGRWIWRAFADGIAVVPAPVLNPSAVAIAAVATFVLANLVAAIPSRTAARTRAAVVLRSE
jgi:predicted lysophospholipase L1 biosynthesis ABC-type transport system permease subunit